MSSPFPNNTFPFLKLPGEIRTMIYRYAIHEDQPIPITRIGYRRSGLLLVNREIHAETWKIALYENQHSITIRNYNTNILALWTLQTRRLIGRKRRRGERLPLPLVLGSQKFDFSQRPHWNNFLTYLKRYHDGAVNIRCWTPNELKNLVANNWPIAGGAPGVAKIRELFVVGGIFCMVKELGKIPTRRNKWHWGQGVKSLPFLVRMMFEILIKENGGGLLDPLLDWVENIVPQDRTLTWGDHRDVLFAQRAVLGHLNARWNLNLT